MAPFSKQQLLQTFLYLLIISFSNMLLANKVHSQSTTSFTFDSFAQDPTTLLYQGDAHVPKECTFLRLTKTNDSGIPGPWSTGRVLYSKPVQLSNSKGQQANFDTSMKFVINPPKSNAADGVAFFIGPVGTTIPSGSQAGNLALYDSAGVSAPLFAVEFDTWSNQWDPSYRHIGINFYSRISYNTTSFDGATGEEVTARITYVAKTGIISVVASTCNQKATLSYVFNLGGILPEQVQVGISSATGTSVHDITYWSFNSTLVSTGTGSTINNEEMYTPPYVSM